MTRFDNLDQFIEQQQSLMRDAQGAVTRNIENARADLNPLITASFRVLEEYYKTILQPRSDLTVVLKKKEKPNIDPNKLGDDHYVYIANFIPKTRPYMDDHDSYNTYWRTDRFGFNDWHPNVALQFSLYVNDIYNQELKAAVGLKALINIKVWGIVPKEEGAITHPDLSLSYGNSWDKWYSTFGINGNQEKPEQTERDIESALTAATPNILMHRNHIRGH